MQKKAIGLFCIFLFVLAVGHVTAEEDKIHMGGALRYNIYHLITDGEPGKFSESQFTLDVFRLNSKGTISGWDLDLEYRFYPTFNTHFIHHGFIGRTLNDETYLSLGVSQVPFGILPYNSHSYWFSMAYYVGLEDDYDTGLKLDWTNDKFSLAMAYYHGAEPEGPAGGSVAWGAGSGRYSYDIVQDYGDIELDGETTTMNLRELGQGNLRAAWNVTEGTEVGASGQVGGIYNAVLDETEIAWAAAGHINSTLMEKLNLQAQYIYYDYAAKADNGEDLAAVPMGAYGFAEMVAAQGHLISAGVAYTISFEDAILDYIQPYVDFSVLSKTEENFNDSYLIVPGALIASGPIYSYFDVATGKNHNWLGGSLAEGADDAPWNIRVNWNIGYYF